MTLDVPCSWVQRCSILRCQSHSRVQQTFLSPGTWVWTQGNHVGELRKSLKLNIGPPWLLSHFAMRYFSKAKSICLYKNVYTNTHGSFICNGSTWKQHKHSLANVWRDEQNMTSIQWSTIPCSTINCWNMVKTWAQLKLARRNEWVPSKGNITYHVYKILEKGCLCMLVESRKWGLEMWLGR